MSNVFGELHTNFDNMLRTYRETKKVGAFFKSMDEAINAIDSRLPEIDGSESENAKHLKIIKGMYVGEYNHQAAKMLDLDRQKFEACAAKYGFPVKQS